MSGPSRSPKAFSQRMAAISPAMPPVLVSSWTTKTLLVFFTDCRIVSSSSGSRVRKSMTSASMPSLASAADDGLADGHGVILGGQLFFDAAVEEFVFEEQHGIIIAHRGFQQSLGVVRGRGIDDLQTGGMHEIHLRIRGVERAPVDAAAGRAADDDGCGRV